MKLSIIKCSPVFSLIFPPKSQYLPYHRVLEYPQAMSFI
jgi:hypothetical protein